MSSELKFDELNRQVSEYYDVMNISKEQKSERAELALELFDLFFFLLTYIDAQVLASVSVEIDTDSIYETFERRYTDTLEKYGINFNKHPELQKYVSEVSKEITDTTLNENEKSNNPKTKNKNTPKVSSSGEEDTPETNADRSKTEKDITARALSIAENESNTVLNRVEYDDIVNNGKYVTKTWLTENDDKVRPTHTEVDNMTIPIEDYFMVGDSFMLFPKDTSANPDLKELVGCRCSVRYNTSKES